MPTLPPSRPSSATGDRLAAAAAAPLTRKDRERLGRRTEMLAAARTVIAEKGFASATLEEIASLAEFGKGTLYNYFPGGKDEILFAVFDELYDDLAGIIENSFPSVGLSEWRSTARERFMGYVERCFEYFAARHELFLILTKEAHRMCLSDKSERLEYFVAQRARITGALTVQVELAIQAGAMRPLPAEAVAQMLFGNISGLQLHQAIHRCRTEASAPTGMPLDPKSSATFLCSVLFDGLLSDEKTTANALQ